MNILLGLKKLKIKDFWNNLLFYYLIKKPLIYNLFIFINLIYKIIKFKLLIQVLVFKNK
jgi:uncharacterized protein YhhL (DUF1145 family)